MIYKICQKNKFLFLFDLTFLMYFFSNRIFFYFAKPNFVVYDEWFDNDLKKTKVHVKNKKNSYIHKFFYAQSNYKVGASENNLQIEIDENREELFNNNYFWD